MQKVKITGENQKAKEKMFRFFQKSEEQRVVIKLFGVEPVSLKQTDCRSMPVHYFGNLGTTRKRINFKSYKYANTLAV